MATNKITRLKENEAIITDQVNQIILALVGDLVPRNEDGVPFSRGGDLGTIHYLSLIHI